MADQNTLIPGGTGTFSSFTTRVEFDNGNLLFTGSGSQGQQGLYTTLGGTLRVVADLNTPIPSGIGSFVSVEQGSIDGANIAFGGAGLMSNRVYTWRLAE